MQRVESPVEETFYDALVPGARGVVCAVPPSRNDAYVEWSRSVATCDTDRVYLYLRRWWQHSPSRSFVNINDAWWGFERSVFIHWISAVREAFDKLETARSLREEFARLSSTWRSETGHLSSLERKVLHHAYQRIIGMGKPAIPLLLEELKARGGHWFWALHHISGEDPAERSVTIDDARSAWLSWGVQKGYLSKDE